MISLIVAVGRNGVIGDAHGMPWHLPADLKRFRRLTLGKPIIMGRTTFAHIGRALDQRTNIVLTRQPDWHAPGVLVAHSFAEALTLADGPEIMVIGGGEVYQAAIGHANRLYLTIVDGDFKGTAFFPLTWPVPAGWAWQEADRETHPAEAKNPHPHTFLTLTRTPHPGGAAHLFSLQTLLAIPNAA